ncbi:hypothetical protein [Streptomyces sp. NBC_00582]|uniref:hypothetical protein n=1 Tax=Streptomyces sp. NBC_00582 TaxID=2975783 RepID=UPI002E82094F|nr:hypothetical protein [Streptomyces sp. NBC_00582]WUB67145.1 hypothetical protein OG852_45465 [Streptomyces sp. NBC_00582]
MEVAGPLVTVRSTDVAVPLRPQLTDHVRHTLEPTDPPRKLKPGRLSAADHGLRLPLRGGLTALDVRPATVVAISA